jgi:hypothetical protein
MQRQTANESLYTLPNNRGRTCGSGVGCGFGGLVEGGVEAEEDGRVTRIVQHVQRKPTHTISQQKKRGRKKESVSLCIRPRVAPTMWLDLSPPPRALSFPHQQGAG